MSGLLVVGSLQAAPAQVPNDNIEQRRVLRQNEAATSATTNCTVQWSCVEEKLTGKCIEYHNDQWFEFTPRTSGRYFVNIEGQKCRDTRGVQLVVLTGQPCEPATYRVLSCTSLGSQDDVFVTLDSLRAGQPYLLDVDGYLKDFCQFTLTVSDKPRGLPALTPPQVASVASSTSRLVSLRWTLPDSLGAPREFRVLRREAAAFRATAVAVVPVQRTTYGATSPEYTWTDTLTAPGRYLYQVITDADEGQPPAIVQQQWYAYSLPLPQSDKAKIQAAAEAAKRTAKTQQTWERRSHRARIKRLAGQRH
ncbi:hypothetical protein HNQ93_003566 [Hymenobacter luteus]|uniref:Uncharacterized protein n=2 Tax=Hymenobacter TaxID=89966 RepID=A0A7W9T341_9BACT|nr:MULTISPECIES: hypothetical protein [Hymenobacter]MBB4602801.1 hypothetical protein [Hymenobacter latericoloratus]MBB6060692.1 hypothetical protein [Hymenobacter luteus]